MMISFIFPRKQALSFISCNLSSSISAKRVVVFNIPCMSFCEACLFFITTDNPLYTDT